MLRTAVAAVLTGCATAVTLAGCQVDTGALQHSTHGYQVAGPVLTLVVSTQVGSVHVTGDGTGKAGAATAVAGTAGAATAGAGTAGAGTAAVTEHISYRHTAPQPTHRLVAGTLTLDDNCPGNETCSVSYDIQVPASATVRVTDGVGVLQLTSLTGQVTAHTNAGDIEISHLSGPIELTDHAGSVLGNVSSARATLRSSVGSIGVTFTDAPATVTATTAVGSVVLNVPGGVSYAVDAHASVGATQIGVSRSATSSHVIVASTRTGTITIEPTS